MRYHLGYNKCGVSLEKLKSETSLDKNCKCSFGPINPSV